MYGPPHLPSLFVLLLLSSIVSFPCDVFFPVGTFKIVRLWSAVFRAGSFLEEERFSRSFFTPFSFLYQFRFSFPPFPPLVSPPSLCFSLHMTREWEQHVLSQYVTHFFSLFCDLWTIFLLPHLVDPDKEKVVVQLHHTILLVPLHLSFK